MFSCMLQFVSLNFNYFSLSLFSLSLSLSPMYRLLADKPNFEFTTRGPMLFKNVSEPIMCYFLDNNTEKTHYYELEVPEDVSYDFMQTSNTPPSTPFVLASSLPSYTESPSKRVAFPFISPEVNVIDPTPNHSPHPSPTLNPKTMPCPFSSPASLLTQGMGGADHAPQRKISAESMTSQNTDGSMTTPSESECSVLSNEETIQSPPTIGSGQSYITPPSIRVQEAVTPTLLVESVIQSLAKHDTIIFPLLEDLQEDTDSLSLYNELPRVTSAPLLDENRGSQTLPREKKRASVDLKSLRQVRSLSVTSDENDSGGEEGGREETGSQGADTSPVRYVRPRTSSINDRVKFFETTGRRRTGLTTTSYLQSDVLENGSSYD